MKVSLLYMGSLFVSLKSGVERRLYQMTHMAPRVLSLQNYGENLCMRAIRDGVSRAGKSCLALLGLRTALCEMQTETTLLLCKSWLFGQNE